jgi:hypothetical protein
MALGSADSAVASPPANDAYPGAQITTLPFTDTGSTAEATGEVGEPDPGGISLGEGCSDAVTPDPTCLHSVWFTLTSGFTDYVTADTCGSDYDTVLASYSTYGYLVPPLTDLADPMISDDDNTCEDNPTASTLTFPAFDGAWRRIVVNGLNADDGTYVLHVYEGPDTRLWVSKNEDTGEASNPLAVNMASSVPGTFDCSLDGTPFMPCTTVLGQPVSGESYSKVMAPGDHELDVRARDSYGNVDAYPATAHWTTVQPTQPAPLGPPSGAYIPPPPLAPPRATISVSQQRLGRALRRGLRLRLDADLSGKVLGVAVVDGEVAKRFGLSRRARITAVAAGSARLASPGTITVVLRFTNKAKVKLRHARRLRLTAFVTVTSPAGARLTTSRRFLLLR